MQLGRRAANDGGCGCARLISRRRMRMGSARARALRAETISAAKLAIFCQMHLLPPRERYCCGGLLSCPVARARGRYAESPTTARVSRAGATRSAIAHSIRSVLHLVPKTSLGGVCSPASSLCRITVLSYGRTAPLQDSRRLCWPQPQDCPSSSTRQSRTGESCLQRSSSRRRCCWREKRR